MKYIDEVLNKITMYRLTLYYLIYLVSVAVFLSFFKFLSYNPLDLLVDIFIALSVCYLVNFVFAKFFKAVTSIESVFITALILVLIVPVRFPLNLSFLVLASTVAMASKYLLTVDKRHIFNPAAFAVASISLLSPEHTAVWWVGTPVMLPFVLLGGLLLLRKIQRETLVFSFFFAYLIIIALGSFLYSGNVSEVITTWKLSVLDSAIFFFMFVMLTEPLTSPTTKKLQTYYSYFTAILYATPQLRLLAFGISPEIALSFSNVFSYILNPNYRLMLSLKRKIQISPDTYVFAFDRKNDFKFIPGQYMEWTLPHNNADSRGKRRYFSISSSPTENEIAMTVKFYSPSSSYKKELINLTSNNQIIATQVAGDFTMPSDIKTPLVFIAGGVGVAPFRSMIKYIIDKNLQTDIILLFTNRTKEDILFPGVFEKAKQNGVRTIYNLTDLNSVPAGWQGTTGYITEESIQRLIADYKKRKFYLSGPQLMVQRFEEALLKAGVGENQIKTDFFPGYSEK